jgi:hypothetical protein
MSKLVFNPLSGNFDTVYDQAEEIKYSPANPPDWSTVPTTVEEGLDTIKVDSFARDALVKEPTGFPNRTDSSLSFTDASRRFEINPTGASFDVYVKGRKFTKTSEFIILSATEGNHYIYYTDAGVLSETTSFSPSLFENNALISIIYWNSNENKHSYFAEERHGLVMDGATHGYLHTVFGARYLSGLALQNFVVDGDGTLNTQAQFQSDSGTIRDEDLVITLPLTSNIPVLFREGTQWRKKSADAYPVIYNGTVGYTGTRLAYNQLVGSSWQLSEVSQNDFVLIHVFATNDIETPFVAILGINIYTTTFDARTGADVEISSLSGLPFAEFVAVGTVIFQTNSTYTNAPKARVRSASAGEDYVDFRGEQLYTPSGVATSHSLLSNLSSDDHLQYYNESRGDARYVKKAGDTMTGNLIIDDGSGSTDTVTPEGIFIVGGDATSEYARLGYFLNLSPTATYQKYSDGGVGYLTLGEAEVGLLGKTIDIQLTGITMNQTSDGGATTTPIMPVNDDQVTVKKYVDLTVISAPSNYTMPETVQVVLASNTITVTLPPASTIKKQITIKNIGTGIVTIDGYASETIDGSLTYDLTHQWDSISLVSNGTGWFIV